MSSTEERPSKLLQDLISGWEWDGDENETFYLTKLAPGFVANPESGNPTEREILGKLRVLLNAQEWQALPALIAETRSGSLRKIEIERSRDEARERERQEAERIAAVKKEKEARRNVALQNLRNILHSDYLGADSFFEESCDGIITGQEFETEKLSFVKKWLESNASSGHGSNHLPDDEQTAAIASLHGDIHVVARAGSGKTTTLATRAWFLLKHCRVAPDEILILAFNRKAALEVRRKLLALIGRGADAAISSEINRRNQDVGKRKRIDREKIEADAVAVVAARLNITLPHVMTFHALAYAFVHPEESILYDGAEDESQGLSRVFQRVIDDHLQNPAIRENIRELMLAHFRGDWERIVEGRYDQSKEEYLQFRRSLIREGLGGEYVKSYGEKVLADFLFEHGIAYRYEHNHWCDGINYRPDFTIFKTPEGGVIIEYFGLKGDPDYDAMSDTKRNYWRKKQGWELIEFSPEDIKRQGVDSFREQVKKRLEDEGVACKRLSDDEIWHLIQDRAIDRFTRATVNFVGRCRKQAWSPPALQGRIKDYKPLSPVEAKFLNIACTLYAAFLEKLVATGEDDFDGMMQRAAETVESGVTRFQRKSGNGDAAKLRFVFIDEFQDFSELFFRLLIAIRKKNPGIELYCVGDDWQAINGFAGSDLKFFSNFEKYIGKSDRLYISTNYRSATSIVAIGNALMAGLGKPASAYKQTPGKVVIADLEKFKPSAIEKGRHSDDIITPAVLRLVGSALATGMNVVMLSRRNALPWFVNYDSQPNGKGHDLERYLGLVRSFFPKGLKERITISTAHKYKGLEKPVVIVLDAVARSYPLIHPDWIFSGILGESPEKIVEEERRLLYVALTRAVDTLVVVTEGRSKSPFLEELEHGMSLSAINWDEYPPVQGLGTWLAVKVCNQDGRGNNPTFAIKDLLKASKYRWKTDGGRGWEKSVPARGFKMENLQAEVWAKNADGIDVRILDEGDTLVARFFVDGGSWRCEIDNLQNGCAPDDSADSEIRSDSAAVADRV